MLDELIDKYRILFHKASASGRYSEVNVLLEEMKRKLERTPPPVDEFIQKFQEILTRGASPRDSLVIMAAWYQPSIRYVNLLSEILISPICEALNEQVVELLELLKSEDSIMALETAISFRRFDDPWFNIPKKALQALYEIGTPTAFAAIKRASESLEPAVRDEAIRLLLI